MSARGVPARPGSQGLERVRWEKGAGSPGGDVQRRQRRSRLGGLGEAQSEGFAGVLLRDHLCTCEVSLLGAAMPSGGAVASERLWTDVKPFLQ